MATANKIDINCDLGEGKTPSDCEKDAKLMAYISSCNIACGGHAGDEQIMLVTLKNAAVNHLKIGAHPGYPDKVNFGRLSVEISATDLTETLKQQIDRLIKLADQLNISLHHIKFHGALYNDIEADNRLAELIANFCQQSYPALKLLGLAGGKLQLHCKKIGLAFIAEGFMDRSYLADGRLTPRSQNGAVITNQQDVISQAISLAKAQPITCSDNSKLTPQVKSICLHGDNPNGLSIAKELFASLQQRGISLNLSKAISQDKHQGFAVIENGDAAFTIIFEMPVSEKLSRKIMQLVKVLNEKFDTRLSEIIPSYQSITLCFDPLLNPAKLFKQEIRQLLTQQNLTQDTPIKTENKLIKIPVCYDEEFGPDLKHVASHNRLTKCEVIRLHGENEYLVHMLGFLPGFLYLGGLNKQLFCPRKSTPDKLVSAGSVGIGGKQTGIYPIDSPGGWQIIGRSPIDLFDPQADFPAIASPLDRVQFVAINRQEYDRLRALVQSGENNEIY